MLKQNYTDSVSSAGSTGVTSAHVSPGMPPLQVSSKVFSMFEFWPLWLIYLPVVFQWIALSIYYRSLSLPLLANPTTPSGGMVGYSKSSLLEQAAPVSHESILTWFTHIVTDESLTIQLDQIFERIADNHMTLPIVIKPDMGCRGIGIKLVTNESEIKDCISHYPIGSAIMFQQLAEWEPEAGIFYVRYPNENKGRIISLALKYTPYVVGDGISTLQELIEKDSRASQVMHLYKQRHQNKLKQVVAKDQPFRLIFAASHSKGAIFRNGSNYISNTLSKRIDEVMSAFPEFYYGRLDVKFSNIEDLMLGKNIAIIEVNGASSESLHIWDRETSLTQAWSALFQQYNILFKIGAMNRARGFKPPGILSLWKAWRNEQALMKFYPSTD